MSSTNELNSLIGVRVVFYKQYSRSWLMFW